MFTRVWIIRTRAPILRYTLNFKGLPYKTEWVEFPDIEPLCRNIGIPPTSKKDDGSDRYTLPAIHDTSTGANIADSVLIAEYLEKTYPNTPKVFPNNTLALQVAFVDAFLAQINDLWKFIRPATCLKLNARSRERYRRKCEEWAGKRIEDIAPKGEAANVEWAKVKDGLANVDTWYAKNGGEGPFLLGVTVSWGDIVVGSFLRWVRIVLGADSQQWEDISSWNNGRWGRIAEALKDYETIA